MPPNESPVSVTRRGDLGNGALHTVVWVRGEQDLATRAHLLDTIAEAARVDDGDIVVDLSGVTFMDASTVGAFVAARNRARASSRSLSVRDPSPRARRVLDLCGLARLIDDDPAPAAHVATAQESARVMAQRRVEPARSAQLSRAPS